MKTRRIVINSSVALSALLLVATLVLWLLPRRHLTLTAIRGAGLSNMSLISASFYGDGIIFIQTGEGGKGEPWICDSATISAFEEGIGFLIMNPRFGKSFEFRWRGIWLSRGKGYFFRGENEGLALMNKYDLQDAVGETDAPKLYFAAIGWQWIAAITAILPLGWILMRVRGAYRRRKAAKHGLCPSCSYDLRATPGRCPECGHKVWETAIEDP